MNDLQPQGRWTLVVAASALAACAGSVDLLAISSLGGAFASVVTGNLVTAGLGLGTGRAALLETTVAAVGGYAVGVAVWSAVWRERRERHETVVAPLVLEGLLLVGLGIGWLATGTHPSSAAGRALLTLAAVAMGGQSIVAQRLRASTTYMTGTLTTAVQDLVMGRPRDSANSWRYLLSLIGGATLAALLLRFARHALPVLPVALLTVAVVILRTRRVELTPRL